MDAPALSSLHRVPLVQIDRTIANPLRPLLSAWLHADEITDTDDQQWRLR
jgi:hypothetical protein